ncbi:hypothetical protein PG995_010110 [Apiospora arundinis]
MQFIINFVVAFAMAATVLGAALPARAGFTSHEVTKSDGTKDVLYLRSDFVLAEGENAMAGRNPPPPSSVPFTDTPGQPVANCPIEMSIESTNADLVPGPATVADCQALMAAMDKKNGYWSATNWNAMYTLAQVGTCKFSALRWDMKPDELKVGNLDVWAYLQEAITNHVTNNQIQVFGNGPCGGSNDPVIRFDIGSSQ